MPAFDNVFITHRKVDIMNTRLWITAGAATAIMALTGCAAGPNEQWGTAGGAVGGNQVGRRADERNYYRGQRSGYYPYNGPTY
jgi:osmotically inducible lipoprotein OsmB